MTLEQAEAELKEMHLGLSSNDHGWFVVGSVTHRFILGPFETWQAAYARVTNRSPF